MKLTEAELTEDSIGTDFDILWNIYGDEIISGDFGISSYDRQILSTLFE